MVRKGTVRARQLACSRAEEVRISRFLANEQVTVREMMEHCGARLGPLTAGRHVLAIQDTTELNYQHHCGRTCGLGTVGNGRDAGLFLHPVLALDAETGACLGLVGAKLWLRKTAKAPNYRDLRIEAKESFRWLEGAQMAKQALDLAAHVTVVADRESDIYEEWVRLPDRCFDLLTRACRDRAIVGGGSLFAFTDTLPLAGRFHLELPARPGKRAAREAKMELRFGSVTIKRPRHCSDRAAPETLTLRIVDVREATPPDNGDEAVHWRLLTTHAVESAKDALAVVGWYRRRWMIEQLNRTLKLQGLDIEASQAESAEALLRLAAIAIQVATRTLQLVLARDGTGQQPAQIAFDPPEIQVLAALLPTLEGRTEKQRNPHRPQSLAWAAWIIARLGGWKGYRSEAPPGPITMHRGITQFNAIASGFHLAQKPTPNG
jgi:hypothetical protein